MAGYQVSTLGRRTNYVALVGARIRDPHDRTSPHRLAQSARTRAVASSVKGRVPAPRAVPESHPYHGEMLCVEPRPGRPPSMEPARWLFPAIWPQASRTGRRDGGAPRNRARAQRRLIQLPWMPAGFGESPRRRSTIDPTRAASWSPVPSVTQIAREPQGDVDRIDRDSDPDHPSAVPALASSPG